MSDEQAPRFRCRVEIEVRFRDLDANNHVNNAVYFTYFEQARIAYLREVRGAAQVTVADLGVVISEATCRYRSPAVLGELLVVAVRADEVRRSSFTAHYEVRERGSERLVATGTTVQIAYDFARNRIRAFSPEGRQAMLRYEAGDV